MKTTYTSERAKGSIGNTAIHVPAAAGGVMAGLRSAGLLFSNAARYLLDRLNQATGKGAKQKRIELLDTLALGGRRQLFLVLCEDQRYLIGAGAETIGSIAPLEVASKSTEVAVKGPHLVRERSVEERREVTRRSNRRKEMAGSLQTGLELWQ